MAAPGCTGKYSAGIFSHAHGRTAPVTQGGYELDAVLIGGCGHVGLPLAIALASRGARIGI
jgi:threonine dehydrogenase-like Zn-dependent dehydrogenase